MSACVCACSCAHRVHGSQGTGKCQMCPRLCNSSIVHWLVVAHAFVSICCAQRVLSLRSCCCIGSRCVTQVMPMVTLGLCAHSRVWSYLRTYLHGCLHNHARARTHNYDSRTRALTRSLTACSRAHSPIHPRTHPPTHAPTRTPFQSHPPATTVTRETGWHS